MKNAKITAVVLSLILAAQAVFTPVTAFAQETAAHMPADGLQADENGAVMSEDGQLTGSGETANGAGIASDESQDLDENGTVAGTGECENGGSGAGSASESASSDENEAGAEAGNPDADGEEAGMDESEEPDAGGAVEDEAIIATDETDAASDEETIASDGETQLGEPPLADAPDGEALNTYAEAAGGTFEITAQEHTPEEIEQYFETYPVSIDAKVTYKKNPVTSGAYDPGALSDDTLDSAVTMLNRIRYVAGLDSVVLNDSYSEACQAGALLNYVNGKLSHYPAHPSGMDDELFNLGYQGCQRSNIAWCSSSGYALNKMTVRQWMGDSDKNNIDVLGHRRWLLNPGMKATGFGAVSGGKGIYAAVYAHDGSSYIWGTPAVKGVTWPARIMPVGYFEGEDAWSFSAGENVEKSSVSVVLTRRKDRKVWRFSSGRANGYFNVDNDSYGQRGCIIFRPSDVSGYGDGDIYDVDIAFNGTEVHYSSAFFTPGKHNKITYVLNGGENAEDNPTWFYSIADTITLQPARRDNYEFRGWYTDAAFHNEITEIASGTNSDLTLYARWVKVTHGSCGKDAQWWLTEEDGILKIKGSGQTDAYDAAHEVPWEVSLVSSVEIEEGITSIGAGMFQDHWNLSNVLIPKSVTSIADNAFDGCENAVIYTKSAYVAEYAERHGIQCFLLTDPKAADPVLSLGDGAVVKKGTKLYISSETTDADIYYTTDGSVPDKTHGTRYLDALAVDRDMTVRAVAVMEGFLDSEVVSVSLTVKDESAAWGDIIAADRAGYATADKVPEELWIRGVHDAVYNGKAVTFPELRIYHGKTLLQPQTDYTVKYTNNVNAGTAKLTVYGKGSYGGSAVATFEIAKLNLETAEVRKTDIYLPYNKGKRQEGVPVIQLELSGKEVTLKNKKDFTLTYPDKSKGAYGETGSYPVEVTGAGNYCGTIDLNEVIVPSSQTMISRASVTKIPKQPYRNGDPVTVDELLTLTCSKKSLSGVTEEAYAALTAEERRQIDYTYSYRNNRYPGTAEILITGVNAYAGTKKVTFAIGGDPLSKCSVEGIDPSYIYTGEAIKPAGEEDSALTPGTFAVYKKETSVIEKEKLVKGTDYLISYTGNTAKGTATVIITGIGGYTGVLKKTFKIAAYDISTDKDADKRITAVAEDAAYTKGDTQTKVIVTDNVLKKTLLEGVDYTLSYKNNKKPAGKSDANAPTVTVKGKGNYAGSRSVSYTIGNSSLERVSILSGDIVYQEKAGICKPKITLTDANGKKLAANTDYEKEIRYSYANDAHVKAVRKIGKTITAYSILRLKGNPVAAEDIIPAGTILKATVIGKGYYAGSEKSVLFRYKEKEISKATVRVSPQEYTGSAVEPSKNEIEVKIGGTYLNDEDYEIVCFSNNIKKGKAGITIRGKGNYGGVKEATFTIGARMIRSLLR